MIRYLLRNKRKELQNRIKQSKKKLTTQPEILNENRNSEISDEITKSRCDKLQEKMLTNSQISEKKITIGRILELVVRETIERCNQFQEKMWKLEFHRKKIRSFLYNAFETTKKQKIFQIGSKLYQMLVIFNKESMETWTNLREKIKNLRKVFQMKKPPIMNELSLKEISNQELLKEQQIPKKGDLAKRNESFPQMTLIEEEKNSHFINNNDPQHFQSQSAVLIVDQELTLKLKKQRLKLLHSFHESLDVFLDTLNWMELKDIPENCRNNSFNKLNSYLTLRMNFHDIMKTEARSDKKHSQPLLKDYEETMAEMRSLFCIFLKKIQKTRDIQILQDHISVMESLLYENKFVSIPENKNSQEILSEDENRELNQKIETAFGSFFVNVQEEKENRMIFNEKVQNKEINLNEELKKTEQKIKEKIKSVDGSYYLKEKDVLNIMREICEKSKKIEPLMEIIERIDLQTLERIALVLKKEVKSHELLQVLQLRIQKLKHLQLRDFR